MKSSGPYFPSVSTETLHPGQQNWDGDYAVGGAEPKPSATWALLWVQWCTESSRHTPSEELWQMWVFHFASPQIMEVSSS